MWQTIITHVGFLIVGFVAGLLVGKRNPKVADIAAQAAAEKAASVDRLKS